MVNAGPKRRYSRRYSRPKRRRMIEEAALSVFAARGYPDTRIEDIAAAADVTKQLLYHLLNANAVRRLGRSCDNCTHYGRFAAMMGCVIWQRVVATLHRAA